MLNRDVDVYNHNTLPVAANDESRIPLNNQNGQEIQANLHGYFKAQRLKGVDTHWYSFTSGPEHRKD